MAPEIAEMFGQVTLISSRIKINLLQLRPSSDNLHSC